MKIAVLYIRECPGHLSTLAMIEQIIKEYRIKATVTAVEVIDPNTPGFLGSPTVRINGQDVERVAAGAARGLACRTYDSDGKLQNTPSREMLEAAIKRAES